MSHGGAFLFSLIIAILGIVGVSFETIVIVAIATAPLLLPKFSNPLKRGTHKESSNG